jgi:hypothetical protein
VLPGGVVLFVELKTPAGKTSKMQDRIHLKLEKADAKVFVIRSFDEFKALIAQFVDPRSAASGN